MTGLLVSVLAAAATRAVVTPNFAVALKNSRRLTSPTNSIVTFPSVSSVMVISLKIVHFDC